MNSKHFGKMPIYIEIDSVLSCFQFISIRIYTKMPMLSTLCIMGKLKCLFLHTRTLWFEDRFGKQEIYN